MMILLNSELFLITLTIGVFLLGKIIYSKTRLFIFNPVLFAITLLIIFLKITGINYNNYNSGTGIISFFLAPSVTALALPLYRELEEIKKNHAEIMISLFLGTLAGLISVSAISIFCGAEESTAVSLLTKSVTSAIAIEISGKIGGEPSLAAVFVVLTGIIGASGGFSFLKLIHDKNHRSGGLAVGAAAHGLGTAAISEKGGTYAAYGGLALCITGIMTSLLAPLFAYLIKLAY